MTQTRENDIRQTKSTCYMCYNACGIIAHTQGNKVLKIEGDPDNPQNYGEMCLKGRSGLYGLDNPHRITTPLRRTNPEKGIGVDPRWEPMSWDEALTIVAARMKAIREDDPRKLIGCTFDAHAYAQFFAWLFAYGTPNGIAGGADFFCGNGMHPVAELSSGAWFLEPDLEHCNYLILVGTQSGFVVNHLPMHLANRMTAARERGMKLVVIDPIRTNAGNVADEWLPIRPGTDAQFSLSMANVLLNELGIYDRDFLKKHTNGTYLTAEDGHYVRDEASGKPLVWDSIRNVAAPFDAVAWESQALLGDFVVAGRACTPSFQKVKEHVSAYSPESASQVCGIPAETIRRIAKEFGTAASIGATTTIDGQELPLRPACVNWYRGPTSHQHGFLTGFSLQLLNLMIGNIDRPGGHLGCNPVGPWWGPSVSDDGLIVPTTHPLAALGSPSYPGRPPAMPESVCMAELFPIAPYSGSMLYEGILDPDKYRIPYHAEMLVICRSNPLMTTINPETVAAALKKLPFIVAFAYAADETTEFADIVFPDAHYLERYDGFVNAPHNFHAAGEGDWHFQIRQPVIQPPPGVTHWMEIMLELGNRIGIKAQVYELLNAFLPLGGDYLLDAGRTYSWTEIIDLWLRFHFGDEHDLEWFRKHGFIIYRRKTLQEAYPREFLPSRVPVYLEHLVGYRSQVEAITKEIGIPWSAEDYQAIPDWKPCESHCEHHSEFDLFAVNCKVPFHTFSITVGNPILSDVQNAQHMKFGQNVLLHSDTARRKGLSEGDEVWVETTNGIRVRSVMKLTHGIHPDCVGFPGLHGRWARNLPTRAYGGPHFNTLLPRSLDRIDKVAATTDMCVKVKIYRAAH